MPAHLKRCPFCREQVPQVQLSRLRSSNGREQIRRGLLYIFSPPSVIIFLPDISPRQGARLRFSQVAPARHVAEGAGVSLMATLTSEDLLTSRGSAIGTVAFMSPEQVRGDDLDSRTDLFSFGLILYDNGYRPGPPFLAILPASSPKRF